MITSLWTAVLIVAGVAILALLLRRNTGGEEIRLPPPDADADADASAAEEREAEALEDEDGETAAITVDGLAFIGVAHGVHIAPVPDAPGATPGPPTGRISSAEFLRPGDFTAARIVRGSTEDPWRLELMGPEGEYMHYGFATGEGAGGALELLERHEVVRYVQDDDDRPLRPSAEQFDEARRRAEETERMLAMTFDDERESS